MAVAGRGPGRGFGRLVGETLGGGVQYAMPILLLGPAWGFLFVVRFLGLGLVPSPDAPRTLRPLQFTIADMLLWTTAVAMVLGLLRWLALDWSWVFRGAADWYNWTFLSLVGLVAMAAMLLALSRGHPLWRIFLLPLSLAAYMGLMDVLYFISLGRPLSAVIWDTWQSLLLPWPAGCLARSG